MSICVIVYWLATIWSSRLMVKDAEGLENSTIANVTVMEGLY